MTLTFTNTKRIIDGILPNGLLIDAYTYGVMRACRKTFSGYFWFLTKRNHSLRYMSLSNYGLETETRGGYAERGEILALVDVWLR